MSLNLTDIKQLLAGQQSKVLRDNRFSVDMSVWNPVQGQYVYISDYPAISVSTPTTEIQSMPFEFFIECSNKKTELEPFTNIFLCK